MTMSPATPVFGALTVLVAWRIYRRIRRNIGRQPLRPRRAITSFIVLSVFSALFLGASLTEPRLLMGIGGGLLAGLLLGFVGLRLTRFETTAEGHFYTPNTPIGVTLSLLLVGRIIYRFVILQNATISPTHPPAFQSPLTFFIFGLTAGYYIVYQAGLFLHSRDKQIAP